MKVDEVPISHIKKMQEKYSRVGKYLEVYQQIEKIDNTGLEIKCESAKEYRNFCSALKSRVFNKKLPFKITTFKRLLTILVERTK